MTRPTPSGDAPADHRPVEVAAEHALGERGDQGRLRRRQRVRPGARHAGEAVARRRAIEHRRHHQRRRRSTPKIKRHLLPPRRRADQLAGLQILEIVVGDGGDAEDDAGDDQA